MSETTNKTAQMTDLGSAAAKTSVMHWPEALIALGLWLAVAWACVLAYGLVKLIELSI